MVSTPIRYFDIAFNATDSMFQGKYHGKVKHASDLKAVVLRAKEAGVRTMMFTGGSLSESKEALELAEEYGAYSTAGIHPTRASEMDSDPKGYLARLSDLIRQGKGDGKGKGRIIAIGECGLDYDRLHFSPISSQIPHFELQLSLASEHSLPLFLHSRAAHQDFLRIMRDHQAKWAPSGGVVHSFTGPKNEMEDMIQLGLFIGINGCSLKTEEGLDMVKALPLDKLLLETDAPYCSITTSHASNVHLQSLPPALQELYSPPANKPEKFKEGQAVKSRLEPCGIGRVAWVVANVKGISLEEVAQAAWENSVKLFKLQDEETLEA
ncbi:TatD-related DNase [Phaffia rhodozyma]|uniref:TatD-related DNase n=1 Tax=Phaffia rhodozyma TaxID=264483 RepID=A0A0F7SUV5_PHARH|nr:TatD-related DNase [Phaffia rhodozyma]